MSATLSAGVDPAECAECGLGGAGEMDMDGGGQWTGNGNLDLDEEHERGPKSRCKNEVPMLRMLDSELRGRELSLE